jgi:late competence protein required for DNA uptake (superfamily II DNA/RNA helicase)
MMSGAKKKPTWNDLKRTIVGLDRDALLGLVHDLYAANKENKAFLHARFGLDDDVLEPYKATISRWVCPDVMHNQDYSVSKAKKAISDYKKAVGHAEGLAELTVFYCESCRDFLGFCSVDDEVYFNALVRMFEQALKWIRQLDSDQQEHYLERLDSIHYQADDWGWGVSSDMGELMAEYGFAEK